MEIDQLKSTYEEAKVFLLMRLKAVTGNPPPTPFWILIY